MRATAHKQRPRRSVGDKQLDDGVMPPRRDGLIAHRTDQACPHTSPLPRVLDQNRELGPILAEVDGPDTDQIVAEPRAQPDHSVTAHDRVGEEVQRRSRRAEALVERSRRAPPEHPLHTRPIRDGEPPNRDRSRARRATRGRSHAAPATPVLPAEMPCSSRQGFPASGVRSHRPCGVASLTVIVLPRCVGPSNPGRPGRAHGAGGGTTISTPNCHKDRPVPLDRLVLVGGVLDRRRVGCCTSTMSRDGPNSHQLLDEIRIRRPATGAFSRPVTPVGVLPA
jgi:hypothetical protein